MTEAVRIDPPCEIMGARECRKAIHTDRGTVLNLQPAKSGSITKLKTQHSLRKKIMSNSTVNYTPEMVAILEQNAPIDYAKAQSLSTQLDRGVRSIIAKCKREGIEYISKPAPAKKKSAPSKADLVGGIAKAVDLRPEDLAGLEKATGLALSTLLVNIP